MNRLILRSTIFALLATALLHVGCTTKPASSGQIRFAQLPNVHGALTHIAEERQAFAERKLSYRSIALPAGPDVVNALKVQGNDRADAGSLAATPVVTMIGAGDSPVILASTLFSSNSIKILATPDSRITKDPASLRGKRIGVTRNTVGDIFLYKLLKKGGLGESDAILVNGRPSDLVTLFAGGNLDAAILWDPFAIQAQRKFSRVAPPREAVVIVDENVHPFTMYIVTTRSSLEAKRSELVQLLRGAIQGEQFASTQRTAAQTLVERWLNLEPGDLKEFFVNARFEVKLNKQQTLGILAEELEWLKLRRPDTIQPADLSAYIDSSLLASIDPSRVKN